MGFGSSIRKAAKKVGKRAKRGVKKIGKAQRRAMKAVGKGAKASVKGAWRVSTYGMHAVSKHALDGALDPWTPEGRLGLAAVAATALTAGAAAPAGFGVAAASIAGAKGAYDAKRGAAQAQDWEEDSRAELRAIAAADTNGDLLDFGGSPDLASGSFEPGASKGGDSSAWWVVPLAALAAWKLR